MPPVFHQNNDISGGSGDSEVGENNCDPGGKHLFIRFDVFCVSLFILL